jgi:hypothetical protein
MRQRLLSTPLLDPRALNEESGSGVPADVGDVGDA